MKLPAICRNALLLTGLFVLGLTSATAADWPRQVTDSRGAHTLESKPLRIVSTSVTLTGCENPSVLQSDSLTHPACSPGCTNGANAEQGTCNNAAAFTDHSPLRTSRHSVRLAKVISVRCSPVSRNRRR